MLSSLVVIPMRSTTDIRTSPTVPCFRQQSVVRHFAKKYVIRIRGENTSFPLCITNPSSCRAFKSTPPPTACRSNNFRCIKHKSRLQMKVQEQYACGFQRNTFNLPKYLSRCTTSDSENYTTDDIDEVINLLVSVCVETRSNYTFTGLTAAYIQGVKLPEITSIDISVQWDVFQKVWSELQRSNQLIPVSDEAVEDEECRWAQMTSLKGGHKVYVYAEKRTGSLTADPDRVSSSLSGGLASDEVWVRSLYSLRGANPPHASSAIMDQSTLDSCITARLAQLQSDVSANNNAAWGTSDTYEAWVERFGPPDEWARAIQANPVVRMGAPLFNHLEPLEGSRVVNLMGSHGTKAVAMALLGADVTLVDISPSNAQYCRELASAAGVEVEYVVSDVLRINPEELGEFDAVVMEMGILHYFTDLDPLLGPNGVVPQLLLRGGRLILRDFHPVSTKLIVNKGKKRLLQGNYFQSTLYSTPASFEKFSSENGSTPMEVLHRRWTLAEVLTTIAEGGLCLKALKEEPGVMGVDTKLPKVFTVVATKI